MQIYKPSKIALTLLISVISCAIAGVLSMANYLPQATEKKFFQTIEKSFFYWINLYMGAVNLASKAVNGCRQNPALQKVRK
ncbi:MAG: hypothetical protein ACXWWC_01485 [Chitinophagaceae bacterium]